MRTSPCSLYRQLTRKLIFWPKVWPRMHVNLPDKDLDSRFVMACEDAWDSPDSSRLCTWLTPCSRHSSLSSEYGSERVWRIIESCLNPALRAFNVSSFVHVLHSMCLWVLLIVASFTPIAIFRLHRKTYLSRFSQDQCTASKLASLLHSPSSLCWLVHLAQVFTIGPQLPPSLCWLSRTTALRSSTSLRTWSRSPPPQPIWILLPLFQHWWKVLLRRWEWKLVNSKWSSETRPRLMRNKFQTLKALYVLERCGLPRATSLLRVLPDTTRPDSLIVAPIRTWSIQTSGPNLRLIKTFLHIRTWHTRYSQLHWEYSLEFNVTYANVVGFLFEVDTLVRHHWSVDTEWVSDYAQVDIIRMCGLRNTITTLIWTMDYNWRHLPQYRDPNYNHPQLPPGQPCAEPVPKAPRLVPSTEEEASFSLIDSDSSDSSYLQTQEDRQREQVPSLKSATLMNCGAASGRTFIEQRGVNSRTA